MVGDLIGKPGRTILQKFLQKNKEVYDFVIVNGENAAAGFGITSKIAEDLFSLGVDVITSGNHIWDKKEIYHYLQEEHRLLRPLNYPIGVPGSGIVTVTARNGERVTVINLQGRVFMKEIDCPFAKVEEELYSVEEGSKVRIIDFHAEVTSEKVAMGWFLDGKTSIVYGTHTHALTADDRILPEGTGYITDIGMTGGFDGIIGMQKDKILERFQNALPVRFEICEENIRLNGIEAEIDVETGKCTMLKRIDVSINEI